MKPNPGPGRAGSPSRPLHATWRVLAVAAMLAAFPCLAATPSLTPISVFRTTDGLAFLSATQSVRVEAENPQFQFAFGFATDETVAPGVLLDSLTLSLGNAESSLLAIFSTSDASGTVWAPATPGTLPLSPGNFTLEEIALPDLGVTYLQQRAFAVTFTVPGEFVSQDLSFYSDFFNNQNPANSLGWVGPINVVPEPTTWALLAVGLALIFGMQWRND